VAKGKKMSKLKFKTVSISKKTNAVYGRGSFKGKKIWFSDFDRKSCEFYFKQAGRIDYSNVKEFRNIPFTISKNKKGNPRVILLGGNGLRKKGFQEKVSISISGKCDRIIFATAVDCSGWGNNKHGKPAATASVMYKDGSTTEFQFRIFFETAPSIYWWGTEPFRSWNSTYTEWLDPEKTEAVNFFNLSSNKIGPLFEWLFPWKNPFPAKQIKKVEIRSDGEFNFFVMGITLQKGDANPLHRTPKKKVLVTGPKGSEIDIEADRGQVFRKRRTKGAHTKQWLESRKRGMGAYNRGADNSKMHADVFTAPDENLTVTVKKGKREKRATFSSKDLDSGKRLRKGDVSIQKLNVDERYINVKIVDESGKPVSARVHFADRGGRYLAPAGHPEMPRTEWNIETGCDCVFQGTPYAYVNGDFQIRVPKGELYVEAVKGFEYKILRKRVEPKGRSLTLKLTRAMNEKKNGYYTADTHVHFLSPTSAVLESEAEDVDVTNLLASQWGDLYTNTWEYTGGLSKVSTRDNLIWVGQENRQHTLGHLSLLGLKEPVYPFCTGDPNEAELGAELENVIGDWCERTRSQGGLSVIPHFPCPICENASLIIATRPFLGATGLTRIWERVRILHSIIGRKPYVRAAPIPHQVLYSIFLLTENILAIRSRSLKQEVHLRSRHARIQCILLILLRL
jgi:hypothetical protein